MNILDLQDKLKNFSQDQLIREMQMPTGQLPQFLLLNEITRRKKMQDSFAQQQDQAQQQTTVAQDAVNAAGMPQGEAQQLAGTMAPQTDMAGNTGAAPQQMMPQSPQPVQGMAGGGIVALNDGGRITSPRIVVRNGQQMLEMPDGSIVPASPDSLRARLELISRMTDPDSSFSARLDQLRQPQPPANVAEMYMPSIGDVPAMAVPQIDQATARIAQPGLLSPPTLGDSRPAGLDAGPSVTQSRLSPTREMMKVGALDPRLDMVPGSVLFKQQQQEVDDFNRRVAEQTAYETARDTAPRSNDPNDPSNVYPENPDAAARAQILENAGIKFSSAPPEVGIIPSGGVSRVGTGFVDRYRENRDNRLTTQPLDDGNRAGQQPNEMEAERELREINARLQDPNLSETDRGYFENRKKFLEFQFKVAESPGYLMEQINRGAANLRGAVDPYIASILSRADPEAAMDYDAYSRAVISGFERKADESAEAYDARMKALGIEGDPTAAGGSTADTAPPEVLTPDETTLRPQARPDDPAVATPDATTKTPGGGGIASVARGAGAPSDFEQELMTMLAAREKRATQDKFLALAQAGMALMSSTQPTFGGALGEAGASGLAALREGQAGSEADRLALLGQIEQSRMGRERLDLERQALAARQAASGAGKPIPASVLTAVNSQIADLQSQLPMVMDIPVQRDAIEQEIRRLNTIANQVLSTYGLGAGAAEDAQPDFVTQ